MQVLVFDNILIIQIACLAIIIIFSLKGFLDGFVLSFFSFITSVFAIVIAFAMSSVLHPVLPLAPSNYGDYTFLIMNSPIYNIVNQAIWFVGILVVLNLIGLFIIPLFKGLNRVPVIGFVNRIIGLFFGLAKSYLLLYIFVLLLSTPFVSNGEDVIQKSGLYHVRNVIPMLTSQEAFMDDLKYVQLLFSPEELEEEGSRQSLITWLSGKGFSEEQQEQIIQIMEERE